MNPHEIKLKRTESVLKELVPEAIQTLNDSRVRMLDVIDVKCSKGKSDCKVYLDPHEYTQEEEEHFIRLISKARPIIEEYCMSEQGWYRSPTMTFIFDHQLEKSKKIEELFKQISKEK